MTDVTEALVGHIAVTLVGQVLVNYHSKYFCFDNKHDLFICDLSFSAVLKQISISSVLLGLQFN